MPIVTYSFSLSLSPRLSASGKTYTVTGPPSDPGILPRSLDVIFNSIDHQQLSSVSVKPKHFSEVVYLSKDEATEMESHKENTLNMVGEVGRRGDERERGREIWVASSLYIVHAKTCPKAIPFMNLISGFLIYTVGS